MVGIVADDRHVLDSYDNFLVALRGQPEQPVMKLPLKAGRGRPEKAGHGGNE